MLISETGFQKRIQIQIVEKKLRMPQLCDKHIACNIAKCMTAVKQYCELKMNYDKHFLLK